MNWKWLLTLLIFAVFLLLPRWHIFAQDAPVAYVVTSTQSVNARSCPHLTCGVVKHFAPGETFNVREVVDGDVVSGSSKWLHVDAADAEAYIHSSLAVPASADSSGPAKAASTVDTEGWIDHRTRQFSLKTPGGYYDGGKLLADEDQLRMLVETYGWDQDETKQNIQSWLNNADMYLFKANCDCWITVRHEDVGSKQILPRQLQAVLVAALESSGVTVLDKQFIDLPAGSAVRISSKWLPEDADPGQENYSILYAVIAPGQLYYLEISTFASTITDDMPYLDAIANSFQVHRTVRDPDDRLVQLELDVS